jgi:hypothetical protein
VIFSGFVMSGHRERSPGVRTGAEGWLIVDASNSMYLSHSLDTSALRASDWRDNPVKGARREAEAAQGRQFGPLDDAAWIVLWHAERFDDCERSVSLDRAIARLRHLAAVEPGGYSATLIKLLLNASPDALVRAGAARCMPYYVMGLLHPVLPSDRRRSTDHRISADLLRRQGASAVNESTSERQPSVRARVSKPRRSRPRTP